MKLIWDIVVSILKKMWLSDNGKPYNKYFVVNISQEWYIFASVLQSRQNSRLENAREETLDIFIKKPTRSSLNKLP